MEAECFRPCPLPGWMGSHSVGSVFSVLRTQKKKKDDCISVNINVDYIMFFYYTSVISLEVDS